MQNGVDIAGQREALAIADPPRASIRKTPLESPGYGANVMRGDRSPTDQRWPYGSVKPPCW